MNYSATRQRENDKRWDYTTSNKRTGTYPIGYCGGYWLEKAWSPENYQYMDEQDYDREVAKHAPFKHKYHTDGHATEQEARDCYKEYLLDLRTSYDRSCVEDELHKCQAKDGCSIFTNKVAEVHEGHRMLFLCDEHRNRDEVSKHFSVGESWHS